MPNDFMAMPLSTGIFTLSFMRSVVFAMVPSRLILFTLPTSTPAISTGDFVSRPAVFLKWTVDGIAAAFGQGAKLAYSEGHIKEQDDTDKDHDTYLKLCCHFNLP